MIRRFYLLNVFHKAYVSTNNKSIYAGGGYRVNRKTYILEINYTDKEGYKSILMIHSKINPYMDGADFQSFSDKVNELKGKKPEIYKELKEPYEI